MSYTTLEEKYADKMFWIFYHKCRLEYADVLDYAEEENNIYIPATKNAEKYVERKAQKYIESFDCK